MRTAGAAVHREANAAARPKLPRFDLAGRCFDQLAKLVAMPVGDRGLLVLNLRESFPDEHHEGRDTGNLAIVGDISSASERPTARCTGRTRRKGKKIAKASVILIRRVAAPNLSLGPLRFALHSDIKLAHSCASLFHCNELRRSLPR